MDEPTKEETLEALRKLFSKWNRTNKEFTHSSCSLCELYLNGEETQLGCGYCVGENYCCNGVHGETRKYDYISELVSLDEPLFLKMLRVIADIYKRVYYDLVDDDND